MSPARFRGKEAESNYFVDIPFPSPWYWQSCRYTFCGRIHEWEKRKEQIYWRGGANPGKLCDALTKAVTKHVILPGFSHPPDHQPDFPRRRFNEMAMPASSLERSLEIGVPDDEASPVVASRARPVLTGTFCTERILELPRLQLVSHQSPGAQYCNAEDETPLRDQEAMRPLSRWKLQTGRQL